MRIAIVAPPFIAVPPHAYGGTELFVAHLAEALVDRGHEVIVYANGASKVRCTVRWTYADCDWPPRPGADPTLKSLDHAAWSLHDALDEGADVVHLNDAIAVPLSRFMPAPVVHTLHHPCEPALSALYMRYQEVTYITISDAQRRRERMPKMRTIHHGLRFEDYRFEDRKHGYLAFLGRMAPMKGPHLAIEVARRSGIPLKLAGEIQPAFQAYWDAMVRPGIDGDFVEYVGEATLDVKNELLGHASALLFPIQWEEPFGLVMIEAMACGTPVLALRAGSVPEIVRDGVSGWICRDVDAMVSRAQEPGIPPSSCREHVVAHFSVQRMAEMYEASYLEAAGHSEADLCRTSSSSKISITS
jgi:glycosyltransferase involved in cell wall biosynthesis